MICPYCQTDNRDDREACYYCEKDLTMLRLIVNKAKHHYNQALEFAERGHNQEAIAELKNTLDLDGTMVNAQVVLGTLYAKQEQFEEARACWARALEIDHRFSKAHEYLEKARNAEYVYPGMRRMLRLCALLGLGLAGAIVAALLFAVPDPGLKLIHEAGSLVGGKEMRSAEAVERLNAIQERSDVSKQIDETAQYFGATINKHWNDLLELAEAALQAERPGIALNVLDKLEAQRPAENIKLEAAKRRSQAIEALFEGVRASADAFYQNKGDYETFRRQAQALIAHARDTEVRDEVQKLYDTVTEDDSKRQLVLARRVAADAPLDEAIIHAGEFEHRHPPLAAEIHALIDERLAEQTTATQKSVRQAIKAHEWDQATQQLDALAKLYVEAKRPAPEPTLTTLRDEVQSDRMAKLHADAQKLFDQEKWSAYLEATAEPATLTRDTEAQAKIEAKRAEALRSWASDQWAWFKKNGSRFENGKISDEDATRAVNNYQRVIENLSTKQQSAPALILFYAAAAQFKLGEIDKAKLLLERVKTEYPESDIIEDDVAPFIERHADSLQ